MVGRGHILAHGNRPGVVGVSGLQPNQLVALVIHLFDQRVASAQVLPRLVALVAQHESAVAGVFGVDIELARHQSRAYHLGVAQRYAVFNLDAVGFQGQHQDVAEQFALGIDFGADPQGGGGLRGHLKRCGKQCSQASPEQK